MASAKTVQRKPKSLVQRLALVAPAEASRPKGERGPLQPGVGATFGLGLAGGGVVGAIVLLAAQVLLPGQAGLLRAHDPASVAGLSEPAPSRFGGARSVVVREARPEMFDVVIDRSQSAKAPFGLRLVGAEDPGMEVLLRDLPPAARPSRGERRDASTWAVRAADLEGLHLALNDGAPDAFDLRIEVLAPAGVHAVSSVARVRLVGLSDAERLPPASVETATPTAAPSSTTGAGGAPAQPQPRPVVSGRNEAAAGRGRPARVSAAQPAAVTVVEIDRRPSAAAPQPQARHWPEGASALGAVARETDRQVWWKLPPPTWSPFLDVTGR
ncbi:MAG: hypothetical protein K2X43_24105 [Hyphomonadaceae bacterium]|nr:hypothetical protein [Hyphomonadaceae bacterium]